MWRMLSRTFFLCLLPLLPWFSPPLWTTPSRRLLRSLCLRNSTSSTHEQTTCYWLSSSVGNGLIGIQVSNSCCGTRPTSLGTAPCEQVHGFWAVWRCPSTCQLGIQSLFAQTSFSCIFSIFFLSLSLLAPTALLHWHNYFRIITIINEMQ